MIKLCGHIMTRLSSWRRLFRLPALVDNTLMTPSLMINTTVCSYSLFSTDLQTYQYQLDHVNSMFLNCLCTSIFLENSKVYFPFLFTDCLQWSSIPMILGCFSRRPGDSARSNTEFCATSVRFPKIKRKTSKTGSLLFCQDLNYKISSDRQF